MEKKVAVSPINGNPVPKGKPFVRGDSRAREMQKKGAEAKKARRTLREELLRLLAEEVTSKTGEKMQANVAISASLVNQAMKGNTKAYELIRDTIGEKPAEKVVINTPDPEIISSVEKALFGSDKK